MKAFTYLLTHFTYSLIYLLTYVKANLEKLNFNDNEIKAISRKLETISVSGTVKIVKTFIGFKM